MLNIYTTGAYLKSKFVDGKYMWVVTGFEEDSYMDGQRINTYEWADNEKDLIDPEEEEEVA